MVWKERRMLATIYGIKEKIYLNFQVDATFHKAFTSILASVDTSS
jgi:hypothetical protein